MDQGIFMNITGLIFIVIGMLVLLFNTRKLLTIDIDIIRKDKGIKQGVKVGMGIMILGFIFIVIGVIIMQRYSHMSY
jgi:hypothetical protein